MAGDWIKWCCGLASKREVRIIASRLQRDRHEIAGRLMVLFEWLGETIHETDFDPESGDVTVHMGETWKSEIDDIVGLPGVTEELASPAVCWITARSEGRITFLRLGRHNGKTAKSRAMEQQKKARQRAGNCPDPVPAPPGPEKRREETEVPLPPASVREARPKTPPPSTADMPDELLTQEQAVTQAFNAGVPRDFSTWIYPDWETRGGRDGAGNKVHWAGYVKKRWNREKMEWESGTHNGKKKTYDRNSNSSTSGVGSTHDPTNRLKGRYADV